MTVATLRTLDNYNTVAAFLGSRATKNVAGNTAAHRLDEETVAIRYHNTFIAKFYAAPVASSVGDEIHPIVAEYTTGGWESSTTMTRLNHVIPMPHRVGIRQGDAKLLDSNLKKGQDFRTIVLTATGEMLVKS